MIELTGNGCIATAGCFKMVFPDVYHGFADLAGLLLV